MAATPNINCIDKLDTKPISKIIMEKRFTGWAMMDV